MARPSDHAPGAAERVHRFAAFLCMAFPFTLHVSTPPSYRLPPGARDKASLGRGVRASGVTAAGGRVWAELGHAAADLASVRDLPESGGDGSGRWTAAAERRRAATELDIPRAPGL